MICPKCGKEIDEGSVFCKFCGASLTEEEKNEETNQVVENGNQEEQNNVEEAKEESKEVKDTKKEEKESSKGFVINTGTNDKKEKNKKENKSEVKESNNSKEKDVDEQNKEQLNKINTDNKDENKIVINGREQTVGTRKRHSIITFGIIIVSIILVVIIALVILSLMSTPEKLYKNFISSTSNAFGTVSEYDSANVSANIAASTDIDELKDSLDGLNLGLNVQYDNSIEEYIAKVNVEKGTDSYLDLTAMINLLDKKIYVGEKNIYNKLISIDVPEESINEIRIALSESNNSSDIKEVSKIVTDTINDNLDKEMFTSQKINVNIDGKDKKVKDNVLSFKYDELVTICKNVTESLKANTKFMSYFEDQDSVKQYLDDFVDEVEMMDEYDYEIHIYTSGLFNTVVGGAFVQIDNVLEESYVMELLKQNNKEVSMTLDFVSDNDKSRVLNSTITLLETNKDRTTMELDFNFPEMGNLVLTLEMLTSYNNGIESIDVSNSVSIDDMTQEDMQQIIGGVMSTPLFGELTQLENGELSETIENNNISSGNNYLTTFTDRKVFVNVPSTFEEIYNGNFIKSYTKDTDLGYCDVELDIESYNEEEYLAYLESTLDYYRESGDYIDISISEPEKLNVNGREYTKVTTNYTYSDGSFSIDYKSDYYYTLVEEEGIYSVEVNDVDGIMTQNELNTFLTIEVE